MEPADPYLMRLARRVGEGLERALTAEQRELHRQFLLSRLMPDGDLRGENPARTSITQDSPYVDWQYWVVWTSLLPSRLRPT